jgi:hypothetical protein
MLLVRSNSSSVSSALQPDHGLSPALTRRLPGFSSLRQSHGHASIVLDNLFPNNVIVGTRGTVSFTSNVPILGLGIRANGLAFTSLKVIAR